MKPPAELQFVETVLFVSSGLNVVNMAAQNDTGRDADIRCAGGMENMSMAHMQ